MNQRSALRRYAGLFRGYRLGLMAFVAMALLEFLATVPLPFVVKAVFDTAIGGERRGLLLALAALMIALQVGHILIGVASTTWALRVSAKVVFQLRQLVFDQLYALTIRYHEVNPIGSVHDRVVHETERVDAMTRSGFALAGPSALLALGILVVLAFIDWLLFLVSLGFVPVAFAVNRATRYALRRASGRLHASIESFSAATLSSLRTMRQTRLLGAEPVARRAEDEVLGAAADAATHHGVMHQVHVSANNVVVSVWAVAILVVGGTGVIGGRITLGQLFSFYAGLALIRGPLDKVIRAIPVIVAGRHALDRVFELLDVDDPRPYRGERRLDIAGHVAVEHAAFAYPDGVPVLDDVTVEVHPGEVVALVGPNGSGKTTIANLVLGLYRPARGRVTVDGVAYDDLDIRHLRRQFGVLTQDPVMIPGTVRDNITYGRPDVSDADVARAVEQAGAAGLVEALERGLDTPAYENGPLLSGGQLQRVALARAMLGRPRVLILDEPTTHLDLAGLEAFLAGLRSRPDVPASILITHEPEVAAMADAVFRVDHGRLTPGALDARSG